MRPYWTLARCRSTPESGSRGGYDGHKDKKGSKVHAAVDTLGHLLALRVSPANEDDRKEVEQALRGDTRSDRRERGVGLRRSGIHRARSASESAARSTASGSEVVKHEEAKRGFVLLPRRWVVERDFAWASRFRRLVKDYERLPETVAGLAPRRVRLPLPPAGGRHSPSQVHNTL